VLIRIYSGCTFWIPCWSLSRLIFLYKDCPRLFPPKLCPRSQFSPLLNLPVGYPNVGRYIADCEVVSSPFSALPTQSNNSHNPPLPSKHLFFSSLLLDLLDIANSSDPQGLSTLERAVPFRKLPVFYPSLQLLRPADGSLPSNLPPPTS